MLNQECDQILEDENIGFDGLPPSSSQISDAGFFDDAQFTSSQVSIGAQSNQYPFCSQEENIPNSQTSTDSGFFDVSSFPNSQSSISYPSNSQPTYTDLDCVQSNELPFTSSQLSIPSQETNLQLVESEVLDDTNVPFTNSSNQHFQSDFYEFESLDESRINVPFDSHSIYPYAQPSSQLSIPSQETALDLQPVDSDQPEQTDNRVLEIDFYLDNKIKNTVLTRLEILMKTLYGKGLFFNDKIMVIKKCWQNARFERLMKMDLRRRNHQLIYQRISKHKRICLLFMACKIYLQVLDDRVTTRRNIYYEHKDLFSVTTCYNLIEMVCSFVNLSRRELNIVCTGKGLIAGNFVFEFENDNAINGLDYRKGFLIPDSLIFLRSIQTDAEYVLVIEKDAIFNKLVDDNFHLKQNAILITSKGFPDTYTRELVNILSEKCNLSVFGMFDCDPFGIEIYCCFRFGSFNLIHHSTQITCPKMVWIGIFPSEISILRLKHENLTESDSHRLNSLLQRAYLEYDSLLSNELMLLNDIKIKTGLQDLNDSIFNLIQHKVYDHLNSIVLS